MRKTKKKRITEAHSIGQALAGELCPYCGKRPPKILQHMKECPKVEINLKVGKLYHERGYVTAFHEDCGDVMILSIDRGLALIENHLSRYVVPITSLRCGGIAEVLETIKRANLSPEQIQDLINHLAQHGNSADFNMRAEKLKAGAIIEVCIKGTVKAGIVKKKLNAHQFLVKMDDGPTITFHKKDIRILS